MITAWFWLGLAADLHSAGFARTLEERAGAACRAKSGGFGLDEGWSRAWVDQVRRVTRSEHEGKQLYVQFLKDRHGYAIERVNAIYGLEAGSFTELVTHDFAATERAKETVRQDDEAFLTILAEQLETLVRETWRRVCPASRSVARVMLGAKTVEVRVSPESAKGQ